MQSRHARHVVWGEDAIAELAQLADFMPATVRDALRAMERMAATGFNYGRLTSERRIWYLPTPRLGIYYTDDGRTLVVGHVVDARRLRELP